MISFRYLQTLTMTYRMYRPSLLATCAYRFLEDLPETSRTDLDIKKVVYALRHRYSKQNLVVPPEIQSVLVVFDLLEMNMPLVKELQLRGSQSTNKPAATKELLSQYTSGSLDERQVAASLLFMVLTPDRRQYSPAIFVQAIHDHIERSYDWQSVIQELDFMPFEVSREQFLSLFDAFPSDCQTESSIRHSATLGGAMAQSPNTGFPS